MKIKDLRKFCSIIFVIVVSSCTTNKLLSKDKELFLLDKKALKGDIKTSEILSSYYEVDLHDYNKADLFMCICFENNPSEGSWNFAHLNFGADEESLRFRYLIFLSEEAEIKMTNSEFFEIKKEGFIEFHKKHPDFKFADDNLEYSSVTNENYQYFHDKAFSGSGLAALKIAQFYEKKNTQNIYADYKRLLDVGCVYNPAEEVLPLFWLRIGAQNGNKECMKKYAEILKQSDDEYDNIRAEFWEKKSKS